MAREGAFGDEGLRDRKKRLLRQRISDTATGMFLERGFDEVTVSEIAAACDVSEKTVFNYFPTKESLLFDREDEMAARISESLRDQGNAVALIDSVLAVLDEDLEKIHRDVAASEDPRRMIGMVSRFSALIDSTPALVAAQQAMMVRLTEVAATALAERVGVDPDDPEPQMAALMVLGLWRTQYRAMERHADENADLEDILRAVREDIHRAASVSGAGLSAFNLVVRQSGAGGKDQIVQAAQAADQARRQLVAAVKQARDGWRQIVTDLQDHHRHDDGEHAHRTRREQAAWQREIREEIRQRRRELRQRQVELRSQQAEARRAQANAQAELRREQAELRRQQKQAQAHTRRPRD
jgi:AcrR family transcriptional regulator